MSAADPPSPRLGRYVETIAFDEKVRAFVPPPLPPTPPIRLDGLLRRMSEADRALGRLDGIAIMLPRQELFLYMYVRKEAVLSSQIEGTQSTLDDLLRFETDAAAGKPIDDIREVSSYVDAMLYGLERMKELPLSLKLLREVHARLLRDGRGAMKSSGEFRRSQNWLGGTRPGNAIYVPPPVSELATCLDALEKFMHEEVTGLPPLLKAGLLHVQFESIHPFLDGNGRLGRLLITLFLCARGVLRQPLLYLSLYFKTHRADYYRLLQEVRERGTWEAWLEFFLDGVAQTADQAFDAATRIVALFKADRERIAAGARAATALRVHEVLQASPYATQQLITLRTGISHPAVNNALSQLTKLGVLEEITGRKRERVFAYRRYLDILGEGARPLRRDVVLRQAPP
jgi:Fic family protein